MLHCAVGASRWRTAFGRYSRIIIEHRFDPFFVPQSISCGSLAREQKLRVRARSRIQAILFVPWGFISLPSTVKSFKRTRSVSAEND